MTRSGGSGPVADTPFAARGHAACEAALAERTDEAEKQTLLAACPTARGLRGATVVGSAVAGLPLPQRHQQLLAGRGGQRVSIRRWRIALRIVD
jgi:hypothetical protein